MSAFGRLREQMSMIYKKRIPYIMIGYSSLISQYTFLIHYWHLFYILLCVQKLKTLLFFIHSFIDSLLEVLKFGSTVIRFRSAFSFNFLQDYIFA